MIQEEERLAKEHANGIDSRSRWQEQEEVYSNFHVPSYHSNTYLVGMDDLSISSTARLLSQHMIMSITPPQLSIPGPCKVLSLAEIRLKKIFHHTNLKPSITPGVPRPCTAIWNGWLPCVWEGVTQVITNPLTTVAWTCKLPNLQAILSVIVKPEPCTWMTVPPLPEKKLFQCQISWFSTYLVGPVNGRKELGLGELMYVNRVTESYINYMICARSGVS